ncbi:MAG: 23S rRNA (adenine(2030)-N(6))-methyltransferase RlmJ [Rhodobacteraceae bacterium]|nr:23S rRNA (adenine(2030)-N(6))-methyltransferase RlmJ [Paracoccaceae bacterium]
MLSYQHAYHAGNRADLHKHDAFARLIAALAAKPRGITVMETHAGRGLYDLASPEALKTGEAAEGILKARLAPGPLAEALAAVRARHGASAYPGSPLIAATLLRPQDRLVLMELHPAEHAALKQAMRGTGAAVHRRDGYEGVLALAPPVPRRGLVLVDPSYEVKSEYEAVPAFVARLRRKWPEAAVLVWYPILAEGRHERLLAALAPLSPERHEVRFGTATGMLGSGLAGINLPFGFRLAPDAPPSQSSTR